MLGWAGLFGGLASKLADAYTARENAKTDAERLRADVQIKALETKLVRPDNRLVQFALGVAALAMCGHAAAVAADRVATVSDDRARAVKIEVDGNSAVFSTQGNAGTAQEEVEVFYSGPPITVGFNSKYLAETLAQCSGQEVTIACGGREDPALITPSEDGVIYVVMSMRV